MEHCLRSKTQRYIKKPLASAAVLLAAVVIGVSAASAFGQQLSSRPDDRTLIVDDAPEMNVIAFGRNVIIRKHAKEVFVWGGDIIVEGRVDGDVAAIGGSIIQRSEGFIGGAVIVIGGSYKPESREPLRVEGKETVMFGMFEEEFREMAEDPSQIFAPNFTIAFVAQRALSALFWFIVTLMFATLAPGAVSRGIERFHLSALKVIGIGAAAFTGTMILVIGSLRLLPDHAGAIVGLMSFALLMLAYGFGRVVLQVSIGKLIQKKLSGPGKRSESIAILIGVIFWTLLLSLPYVWTIGVLALFATGVGLVLTARQRTSWSTA